MNLNARCEQSGKSLLPIKWLMGFQIAHYESLIYSKLQFECVLKIAVSESSVEAWLTVKKLLKECWSLLFKSLKSLNLKKTSEQQR